MCLKSRNMNKKKEHVSTTKAGVLLFVLITLSVVILMVLSI